jgi:PhnB protein
MKVEPYLFFNGRCDEALAFYKKALGAEVQAVHRFKETPDPSMRPPGMDEKVMHATFKVGETQMMASDGRCQGAAAFEGFSLSLSIVNEGEAKRVFNALSDGGKVQMPLGKTFYSPAFGMVEDRFGVGWMVFVPMPT